MSNAECRCEIPERLALNVSHRDARALYDHLGTMPWAPGSWSNNLRALLSESLARAALGVEGEQE